MLFLFIFQVQQVSSLHFSISQVDPILIIPFKSLNLSHSSHYSVYLNSEPNHLDPVLLAASDLSPTQCNRQEDKWTCNSSYQDIYSYTCNLSSHFLSLPKGKNWHLSLLTSPITKSIFWNLTIILNKSANCIEGCQGTCKAGNCVCNKSYIGNDCSEFVHLINNETRSKFKINEFDYKFFRISGDVGNCEVFKNRKKIWYFLTGGKINSGYLNLPTRLWSSEEHLVEENIEKFRIKLKDFESLGIWTEDKVQISFNCSEVKDSGNKDKALIVMWILIAFTIFVVSVWFVVIFVRVFKSRFMKFSKTAPNNRFFDDSGLKVVENSMDKEDVCVICLESFHSGNKIRDLECNHRYHQICIENWLQTHDYCCICKQNYSETQTK